MNYLVAEGLSKSYGERDLFRGVSLTLAEGQKVALIARNGVGKTTLLNILAGKDSGDNGSVEYPSKVQPVYLEQSPFIDENVSILDNVLQGDSLLINLIKRYEAALLRKEDIGPLVPEMDALDGWGFHQQLDEIVHRLDLPTVDSSAKGLSGGQRKRIALARILVESPKFVILDEPTNHLDIDAIEWLQNWLKRSKMTILFVTHDRYFLDAVCNTILEMDGNQIYRYSGSYSEYLQRRSERIENDTTHTLKAKAHLKSELEWMRRQPKARGTKSRARINAYHELNDSLQGGAGESELNWMIAAERLGAKTVELKSVKKAYGDRLLVRSFSYNFRAGEKVGIVGPNGAGKSTLLNMIANLAEPDGGKIITGETVKIGYYRQLPDAFIKPGQKVIEAVQDIAEAIPTIRGHSITAAQLLGYFGFGFHQHHDYVERLSGGELRRLYLLTILMGNPNFLILDEPTNDLDIQTLNSLEDYLVHFQGCLLLVTHDRYFMDKLVDHLFILDGKGEVDDFYGNFTDYRERVNAAKPVNKTKVSDNSMPAPQNAALPIQKLSFKQQRELENLEKEIAELEKTRALMHEKMAAGGGHSEIAALSKELIELEKRLAEAENRWLELSELA